MLQRSELDTDDYEGELAHTIALQQIYFHLNKLELINSDDLKNLQVLPGRHLNALLAFITDTNVLVSAVCLEYLKPVISHLAFMFLKKISRLLSLEKNDFMSLLSLPESRFSSLARVLDYLSENNLLSMETFRQAFNRISAKVPGVPLTRVDKQSRKIRENNLTHSSFTLANSLTFFIQHDEKKVYFEGSIGKVKKAYVIAPCDNNTPTTYSVKIYADWPEAAEYAHKNAKYQALLGRESWFFKRGNVFSVVSQWQEGKPLYEFSNTELLTIPIIMRFTTLVDALSQLELLHAKLRTHNDLTPGNFIADFSRNKMALIDFDKVKKSVDAAYHDDIEALSFIVKRLFPEVFFHEKHNVNMESYEYVIFLLVSAMTTENPRQRCTIRNALNFCQKILFNESVAISDSDLINKIASQTIFRDTVGFEDILRGTTNSRKFI